MLKIRQENKDEENSTIVVNGEVLGNTQYVTQLIGKNIGEYVFRLEPVDSYPTNHDDLLQRAMDEMRSNVIQNGFSLSRTNMESAPIQVTSWLQEIYGTLGTRQNVPKNRFVI